jgi:hypothetical protein
LGSLLTIIPVKSPGMHERPGGQSRHAAAELANFLLDFARLIGTSFARRASVV